jgi:flagellar hook-associated protein 2
MRTYEYKEVTYVISSVYNYYLSTYGGKEVSKYDSHKKSDLKNVYNAMLMVNRKSPLYKFEKQDDVQKNAIDIKETARDFKNVAAAFSNSDGTTSVFSKKKAASSDENVVQAKYIGEENEESEGFYIEVKSVAASQTNTGHFLNPEEKDMKEGSYSFDFAIGDYTYEFSFDVMEGESNRDVQSQVARLINRAEIGVDARVNENEYGQTAIEVTSQSTGIPDKSKRGLTFMIATNEKSEAGNLVEQLGMGKTTVTPKNAVFTIDGEEHMSSSNIFNVGDKYRIRIKGETEDGESVKINLKPDFEAILENVTEFVDSYNSMIELAKKQSEEENGSDKLLKDLKNTVKMRKDGLESAGFSVQEDGSLKVNEAILIQSDKEGKLEESLEQLDSLKQSLVNKANDMSVNPMKYVQKKMIAYPNPVRNFNSPYVSSIYSGMMFNGYI